MFGFPLVLQGWRLMAAPACAVPGRNHAVAAAMIGLPSSAFRH